MLKLRGLPAMGRPLFFSPIRYCHPACGSSREGQPIPPRGVCNGAAHDVFVFTVCEMTMQGLHTLFTVCEMITQGLHGLFTVCEMIMQGLRGLFTVCEMTIQGLHGLFTVCEMTMQHLHSVVAVCETTMQHLATFSQCAA